MKASRESEEGRGKERHTIFQVLERDCYGLGLGYHLGNNLDA